MKETILERLKAVIAEKSTSPSDFSKKIGIAQTTLSNQLKSPRGVSVDVLMLTLEHFSDVSAEWLFRGKGEMILSDNLPPILGDESENDLTTHVKLAHATKEIDHLYQEIATLKEKILKQAGCIEWQKDFISELIAEKTELEKKIPNETIKDID